MGQKFFDQYSLWHASVGVSAYFLSIPFGWWITIHSLFELIENSKYGVYFIDTYLTFFYPEKGSPDSISNQLGDTVFAILGFLVAKWLDKK